MMYQRNGDIMNIQWYPGHMTKAKREMIESLKLVDAVIELLDARIPKSSRNPDIDSICGNKPRIAVLNKSDLADKAVNKLWVKYFQGLGLNTLEIDSLSGKGIKDIPKVIQEKFKERDERLKAKGIISKPVRVMIVGIPNVGKSSLINRLSGRASAKTGDKPGVTRGKQWIKIIGNLELLDTPGILWPKFEDEEVGLNLAFTGAIRDDIMDIVELSIKLIDRLKVVSPRSLSERYKVKDINNDGVEILDEIALNRGCILQGGVIDTERIAKIILDEYRGGKLGKISLEKPE
jgi:ribosome biogenesis GTPase A